jgi:hypothetical protein
MRRCDTCEFWVLGGETPLANEKKHPDDREGYCRRHAPAPFDHNSVYEVLRHLTHLSWAAVDEDERKNEFDGWEEASLHARAWPMTTGSDWCGDWQKRSEDV